MYQVFKLGEPFHPKDVNGRLIQTKAHESVYGAYSYLFDVDGGQLYLSVLSGNLQEVTYSWKSFFLWSTRRKNKFLFKSYNLDGKWVQVVKNDFGRMFKSENEVYHAAWCRKTKSMSFGTMFFFDEKHRISR